MENSVLSDAAGVQKNISKMYEEYAQKLGKTTDSLTQAEKAQAVYDGIMAEASMFTGSAKEMAEGYQGQQAQLNATNLELSRTIGESMIPALTQYSSLQLSITKGLTEFIKNNKTASSGIITLTTGLLATVTILGTVRTALLTYTKATGVANTITKTFTASLMANPLFWGGLAISAGLTALNAFNTKMQESIEKMDENTEKAKTTTELLNSFMENKEYTEGESIQAKNIVDETQAIINSYEERKNKIDEIQKQIDENLRKYQNGEIKEFQYKGNLNGLSTQLYNAKEALKEYLKENEIAEKDIERYKKRVDELNKTLEINSAKQAYLTKTNISTNREQLINIAQTKADIQGKKELLNVLKQGKTETDEYKDAKSKLVKVYPELAKVNENTIASTESVIDAEEKAAETEWALAQASITASIAELSAMQANKEKMTQIAVAMNKDIQDVTDSITATINALSALSKLTPEDFKGSIDTTTYKPTKTSSSKSYQNKALDNYKKQIEYKKSLDQISLKEEIQMYQTALKKYAKTQDEKMELNTKVYELQKELQEKELDNYTNNIEYKKSLDQLSLEEEIEQYQKAYDNYAKTTEQKQELEVKLHELRKELAEQRKQQLKEEADAEKEALDKKTQNYLEYMKTVSNYRYYNLNEQIEDYNTIIKMHKEYLDKIMQDERYTLEERKNLYEEELKVVKDYEEKIRDIRINSINTTVNQLTNAIKSQLSEMQKTEEDAINQNIKLVEKWRDTRIDAINAEYDARIEGIEKELKALDEAEKKKSRGEEDSDYDAKKKRLEDLIAFEHDATTKANYEKELEKLTDEYNKTLDKRALEDKKQNLKEQQDLLKEEQKAKVEAIKTEAETRINSYKNQLEVIKGYYDEQVAKARETAEKLLINAQENQEQILHLLSTYNDRYEVTGQTFGEMLARGFGEVAEKRVAEIISNIQSKIDAAISSAQARYNSAMSSMGSSSGARITNNSVTINQNNTITSPVDSPSVAYKKQETLNRDLANQISGVF